MFDNELSHHPNEVVNWHYVTDLRNHHPNEDYDSPYVTDLRNHHPNEDYNVPYVTDIRDFPIESKPLRKTDDNV